MARFESGWIKFYRETVNGDIGARPFLLGLFVRLLLWANWKESSAIFKGERIKVQAGQVLTGLRELSPDVEEDPYLHKVRNALDYLEKRGTITQLTSNRGRLITICNWASYQGQDGDDCNLSAIQAQTESNLSANAPQLSEEVKKRRKKEEAYSPEFEASWEAFGKVGKKKDAAKAHEELGLSQERGTDLLAAIRVYLADCKAKQRTQMYFGTFLREDWSIWIEKEKTAPKLKSAAELRAEMGALGA